MISKEKSKTMVANTERERIDRNVLIWLNKFPDRSIGTITTETQLKADESGMALSAITSAYAVSRYIVGGYLAEYQFKVIYRIKPGNSMDKSLLADELLNKLGEWSMCNPPDLGEGIHVQRVEPTSQAELLAIYENGDEDHQILMKITYEVL